ncbi:histone H2B, partial [Striga asiatica]
TVVLLKLLPSIARTPTRTLPDPSPMAHEVEQEADSPSREIQNALILVLPGELTKSTETGGSNNTEDDIMRTLLRGFAMQLEDDHKVSIDWHLNSSRRITCLGGDKYDSDALF